MRIFVVEDEPLLRDGLADLLRGAGHEVETAADGERAVRVGSEQPFDLVLLDVMLPRLDGIAVCRRLRMVRPGLPILMLTARGAEDDKVDGLTAGADDYVTKPFGARELLARIEALGRRSRSTAPGAETVEGDGCHIDLGRCTAKRGDAEVLLTAREAGILRLLHRNRARGVTRGELLEQVWGLPPDLETRTVDVTIGNLRQKIERDPASPRLVVAIKGVGYAWGPGAETGDMAPARRTRRAR